jgi:hypothetical protein
MVPQYFYGARIFQDRFGWRIQGSADRWYFERLAVLKGRLQIHLASAGRG